MPRCVLSDSFLLFYVELYLVLIMPFTVQDSLVVTDNMHGHPEVREDPRTIGTIYNDSQYGSGLS